MTASRPPAHTAPRPEREPIAAPVARDRWKKVVAKAYINNTTKAMLLAVGNSMDREGRCQISNEAIAEAMGWSHQRSVSRHLANAFRARYLARVGGGHRGYTSVYQAILPGFERGSASPPTGSRLVDAPPPAVDQLSQRRADSDRWPGGGDPKEQCERSEREACDDDAAAVPARTGDNRREESEPPLNSVSNPPEVRRMPKMVRDAYASFGDAPPQSWPA